MAKPQSGTAAVSVGFGSKVQGGKVVIPRYFEVLVREQTLHQRQKTVQAGMGLYQSVQEEIMCNQILIY